MTVTLSPLAKDDLTEIAEFIARDNPIRALTFVDEIEDKCQSLEAFPGVGTLRPELGVGVKMLPYGRYVIFYRDAAMGPRVERIMHSARDIGDDDIAAGESE